MQDRVWRHLFWRQDTYFRPLSLYPSINFTQQVWQAHTCCCNPHWLQIRITQSAQPSLSCYYGYMLLFSQRNQQCVKSFRLANPVECVRSMYAVLVLCVQNVQNLNISIKYNTGSYSRLNLSSRRCDALKDYCIKMDLSTLSVCPLHCSITSEENAGRKQADCVPGSFSSHNRRKLKYSISGAVSPRLKI